MNRARNALLVAGLLGTTPTLAAPVGPHPDKVKQLESLNIFEYPTDGIPRDAAEVNASGRRRQCR